MKIYLDANAIIYSVEGAAPLRQSVIARLSRAEQVLGGLLITSRLSRLECRVKPLRDQNAHLLATYDAFFSRAAMRLVEINSDVIERATSLRAAYRFKTPDSIHLASAIEQGADSFLTGDRELTRCREISVEVI